jgi:hypothetical protein
MPLVDAVGPLATLGLEGFDVVPGLLHRAGHEAAHGMLLPAHLVHDLGKRGAVLPLEHGHYPSGLAALPRLGGLRRFLRRGGLLVALAFAGAPLAAGAPPLAFLSAFGLAASAKLWMRSQMRLAALLAFLNPRA